MEENHYGSIARFYDDIRTVCEHLAPSLQLVLSIQNFHKYLSLDLPDGGKYTQRIHHVDTHTIREEYFKTNASNRQTETLRLSYIDRTFLETEMWAQGFSIRKVTSDDEYMVLERKA